MYEKRRIRKKRRNKRMRIAILIGMACLAVLILFGAGFAIFKMVTKPKIPNPEETLNTYITCLQEGNYEAIYELLNTDSKAAITKEALVERYTNIYGGIEAVNIKVTIDSEFTEQEIRNRKKKQPVVINYTISLDTLAGPLTIPSSTILTYQEETNTYQMVWDEKEIFPGLKSDLKVKVKPVYGERGTIYDAYQNPLAVKGEAWSAGIVPGKLTEPREESMKLIAQAMDVSEEKITKALNAKWVKDDLFVPIRTISKSNEDLKTKLLEIPGVLLSTTETRIYPQGPVAGHLVGYVQNITAEELNDSKGKKYNSQSVIGKAGIEYALEDTLRSQDGYTILLTDQEGNEVSEVLSSEMSNGKDARLTIISSLQEELYKQLAGEKGFAVAMNPQNGDVLALVSAPSFDSNDFAFGYTTNAWNLVNEDANQPLYNRAKGIWCPGSSFKPIVAALALENGTLDPNKDVKNEGLSWQKDESWGDYKVTTLKDYPIKNLQNALIYSDNIYFAKTALNMGKENFSKGLDALGFNETIPFTLNFTSSSYGKDKVIADEIQLADSGYGQGKMLVNPLHMACLYSAFYNGGNIVKPNLLYGEEGEYWKENAFSKETADTILNDLTKVVESPEGTAHEARMEGRKIAGKTGTAEIKASKEDTAGTELGWFIGMSAEQSEDPILIIMMIEDVKDKGGSHYVIPKVKAAIEKYYQYSS